LQQNFKVASQPSHTAQAISVIQHSPTQQNKNISPPILVRKRTESEPADYVPER